jgi:hypothetical protein
MNRWQWIDTEQGRNAPEVPALYRLAELLGSGVKR